MIPLAVNYHLTRACDLACTFCFAHFPGVRGQLALPDARRLIAALADAGVEKINFAGGEPTIHPHLAELIRLAKAHHLVTSIVTNGFRAAAVLDACEGALDWLGLSIDSSDPVVQGRLGRKREGYLEQAFALADLARARGVGLKLNTVVCTANLDDDLTPVVERLRPARWKLLQVQAIVGENDGQVEPLLITKAQFDRFVDRHRHLSALGVAIVPEDTDAIRDSYAMVDPAGRFFGNTGGINRPSEPILEVGVATALAQVGFDPDKLERRGGRWEW